MLSPDLKKLLDKKVKTLVNIFKKEFILVKSRKEFDDNRNVKFLNLKKYNNRVFNFGDTEIENLRSKDIVDFAACNYEESDVKLIYL
jgi:predicted membrane protein